MKKIKTLPATISEWKRRLHFWMKMLASLVIVTASISIPAQQPNPTIAISKPALEERISQLKNEGSLSDEERSTRIDLYTKALERLDQIARLKTEATLYADMQIKAPLEEAELKAQLARLPEPAVSKDLTGQPLSELQGTLAAEELQLLSFRNRASQIDSENSSEKSFDIQKALADVRQVQQVEPATTKSAQNAESVLATITAELRALRIQVLEQRLLSRPARMSLLAAERNLVGKKMADAEARVEQLRSMVTRHRQSDAQRMVNQAKETVQDTINEPPAVKAIALEQFDYAQELARLVADHDKVLKGKESTAREAQKFEKKYSSLTAQLKVGQLGSSPEFGAALRTQRDQLNSVNRVRIALLSYEKILTERLLRQFQLDALRDPESQLSKIDVLKQMTSSSLALVDENRDRLIDKLLGQRANRLEQLSSAYAVYIDDLTTLIAQLSSEISKGQQYANLIDQHLLWMPSAHAMGVESFTGLGSSFQWLIGTNSWRKVAVAAWTRAKDYPFVFLIAVVLAATLIRRRNTFLQNLAQMKGRIGHVNQDKFVLTLQAVWATFALALPGPLFVLLLSGLFYRQSAFAGVLAVALFYGSMAYAILEFFLQSLRSNGLAELHFKWNKIVIKSLKSNLPWFMCVIIPLIVLNFLIENHGTVVVRDSLGRVSFIIANIFLAIFSYRVLHPERKLLKRVDPDSVARAGWKTRYIAIPLLIILPLSLALLSIFGYHYTALKIDIYLVSSAVVVLAGTLLFFLIKRGLAIGERQLALERIRAKRLSALANREDKIAAEAAGEGVPTEIELQEIDMQTISEHTHALLRTVVFVLVAIGLWRIWGGFLPAFKIFDNVNLWSIVEIVDGVPTNVPITLWNIVLAVLVSAVTFLSAKNIPGLLEITVLNRLKLEVGTNYAFTTISRYLIVIVGSIAALQLLGAQWSKLQWLIAALSVGLGFGLQEIVANFVSGIVLLFERPIRIGDTVTVGDQWGTVSRIRIRATTIVDWDRRELVIPNKTFITERLVNWTLTDPITRMAVSVGVAYGSDVALTEKILMDIARANNKVLKEPPPTAFFLNFGESSLDFQLRVFVKGVRDLIPTQHELHVAIDREFRAHNIEISFPQRDLHFDPRPIEVKIIDSNKLEEKSDIQNKAGDVDVQ